jgi:hypothetical protein
VRAAGRGMKGSDMDISGRGSSMTGGAIFSDMRSVVAIVLEAGAVKAEVEAASAMMVAEMNFILICVDW